MKQNILNNIEKIYRNSILTTVIIIALIVGVIIVTIAVLNFKLIASKSGRMIIGILVPMGSVLLLVLQLNSFYPIYKDHRESSYIIVENATVLVMESSSSNGGLDYTHLVHVEANGIEYELKMQADHALSIGTPSTGTLAYLKYSNYLIWYDLD